jgi:hypothetical protein
MESKGIDFTQNEEVRDLVSKKYNLTDNSYFSNFLPRGKGLKSMESEYLSDFVINFFNTYKEKIENLNLEEAIAVTEISLQELDGSEMDDDLYLIAITLISTKVIMESYIENPAIFGLDLYGGNKVTGCASSAAIGAAAGAFFGGVLFGAIGTLIGPAGTYAGVVGQGC